MKVSHVVIWKMTINAIAVVVIAQLLDVVNMTLSREMIIAMMVTTTLGVIGTVVIVVVRNTQHKVDTATALNVSVLIRPSQTHAVPLMVI
jgi:hypothetical protein